MKLTFRKACELCGGIPDRPRKKGQLKEAIKFAVGKIVHFRKHQDDESSKLFSQCKAILTKALRKICHCEICGTRCSEEAVRCSLHTRYKPQLFLCFVFVSVSVIAAPVKNVATLYWDYPTNEVANVSFNVYFSTNISTPSTNWTVITNVPATTNVVVPIAPGNNFWFVTATNEWGESIPSNTATATVARIISGTKIK